jgi:hypothetical protein
MLLSWPAHRAVGGVLWEGLGRAEVEGGCLRQGGAGEAAGDGDGTERLERERMGKRESDGERAVERVR